MAWILSQYGARQHYATARAFQQQGTLRVMYTEAWAGILRPLLRMLPGRSLAFGQRWSPDIPSEKVVAFNSRTMFHLSLRRLNSKPRRVESEHQEYIRQGKRFCKWVNRDLLKRPLAPEKDVFYGCKSVCLETLVEVKKRGLFTLVDQADPSAIEEKLIEAEREKWPGWEVYPGKVPTEYYDRCRQEWDTASMVMVYSNWTRQAIIDLGVPAEKVVVVPLAYELTRPVARTPRTRSEPLTVLWLGNVLLRKGIPYFLEAARLLKDRNIRFVVAGQLMVSQKAVDFAPANVSFIGRVVRGQAEAVYRSADLFVLPTVSDSFAITQVEAMAHGLPVIATPRCGEVVTEGSDGFIVPVGDAAALATAIATLDDDRALLEQMSDAALAKSRAFSIEAYARLVRSLVVNARPELAGAI